MGRGWELDGRYLKERGKEQETNNWNKCVWFISQLFPETHHTSSSHKLQVCLHPAPDIVALNRCAIFNSESPEFFKKPSVCL